MHRLIIIALLLFPGIAWGGEFKPLSRDEPIVRMVLQEAANEPFAGMVAVAGVALDRVADRRWPSTTRKVVYQPPYFLLPRMASRRSEPPSP